MGFFSNFFGKKNNKPQSNAESQAYLTSKNIIETMLITAQVAMDKEDFEKAVEVYKDILKLEPNATAEYNLGSMFAQGKGVEQDLMKGAYHFHKAELLGDEQAGKLCLKCSMDFVHQDLNDKTTEQIYTNMAQFIKHVYPDTDDVNLEVCRLLYAVAGNCLNKEAYSKAFKLFRAAGEFGSDGYSQNYLAVLYNAGRGIEQNDIAALYWFDKAVDNGAADVAQTDRDGLLNYYKENFPTDVFSATMLKLAKWCQTGSKDVPKDEAKAVYWRKIAENNGEIGMVCAVSLINGDCILNENPDTVFEWPNIDGKNIRLSFQTAYEITYRSIGGDVGNAVFRINGRKFTCRDSMSGQIVKDIFSEDKFGERRSYNICKLKNGVKALRHYHNIPTFDSDDREWDGDFNISLYKDKQGINLIHIRSGYRIPRVYIYVELQNWDIEFASWLKYL